jgi:molecular chaperone DnaK (HSP70)
MLNQDKLIIETYERKNELESMIYNWKEKINGNYREFAKENEVPEILQFLEVQNEWLYNEGQ